ncbi:Pycsar system effector family protein [Streptomyces olivoreticuli]
MNQTYAYARLHRALEAHYYRRTFRMARRRDEGRYADSATSAPSSSPARRRSRPTVPMRTTTRPPAVHGVGIVLRMPVLRHRLLHLHRLTAAVDHRRLDRNLDAEVTRLESQLTRCDSKASLLLAFAGAVLLYADSPHRSAPTAVLLTSSLGSATLIAAVTLLLLAVWAHTKNGDNASWPLWARLSPGQIRTRLSEDLREAQISTISRLLAHKYARINAGIALLIAGVLLVLISKRLDALM